jgi:hypothetical protein
MPKTTEQVFFCLDILETSRLTMFSWGTGGIVFRRVFLGKGD